MEGSALQNVFTPETARALEMTKPRIAVNGIDWNTPPLRPTRPAIAAIPLGAPTCTITCRACEKRDNIAIDWAGLLCRVCRADLDATERRIGRKMTELDAEEAADFAEWEIVVASMDDATAERWARLVGDLVRTRGAYERACTAQARSNQSNAEMALAVQTTKIAYDKVQAAIARTAAQAENPLAPVILAEKTYLTKSKALADEKIRLQMALDEVAAARDGRQLPF
jgi:hypothetical protein